ncbi:MAG: hypothetical protein ACOX8A_12250, partial [Thermacetogeniaceae bacterium]
TRNEKDTYKGAVFLDFFASFVVRSVRLELTRGYHTPLNNTFTSIKLIVKPINTNIIKTLTILLTKF